MRARGFDAPAAGKTGTSHDAWFAGYTTNLLCIVWVGNDDYSDIKLAGGAAAAPIWAEFMKRAVKLPQYCRHQGNSRSRRGGEVQLDKVTNRLATPVCPETYTVAFIAGTEPKDTCDQAFGDHRGIFSKIFGLGSPAVSPPPTTTNGVVQPVRPTEIRARSPDNRCRSRRRRRRSAASSAVFLAAATMATTSRTKMASENGNNPKPD